MAAKKLPSQFPALVARRFDDIAGGNNSLTDMARSLEEMRKLLIITINDHAVILNSLQLPVKTDATRGAAGTAGILIFNSDDGRLNIDDGTNWTLPDGTTT